jgi:hypothetical protein
MLKLDQIFDRTRRLSSVVIYNNDETDFRPFLFVLNVKGLTDGRSFEIAPGYILRKANADEIKYIKEFLTKEFSNGFRTSLWENDLNDLGKSVDLPKARWRYHVVELSDDQPDLGLLEAAVALAPLQIELGPARVRADIEGVVRPALLYRTPSLFQSLNRLSFAGMDRDSEFVSPSKADGAEILKIFTSMKSHDHAIVDLKRVIELLIELRDLPRYSPLQILGYFAILESVLTHQPKPDDRYESITRQITQKLALLNKRWRIPLDYSAFKGAAHDKIWAKMYAYRSAIAHGRDPDFKSNLTILENADAANALIVEAVKKSIRQAYAEPQLLADLHSV